MNKADFDDLVKSIQDAGRIRRGEGSASRRTIIEDSPIADIRKELGLSQHKFAALIGISVNTLQNWEQGRRLPRGPAVALLKIIRADPVSALRALNQVA